MITTSYLSEILDADDKIRRLELQLRQLRIQRNALVPVNQLPCEVLAHIMHNVQQDAIAQGDMAYGWISATQVCRYWRDTAMGCSSLWGTILVRLEHLPNIAWTKELCKRSRSAPISLLRIIYDKDSESDDNEDPSTTSLREAQYPKLWRILRRQLHRIKEVAYEGGPQETWLFPHFNSEGPSLESLVIRGGSQDINFPWSISGPKLRRLHLEQCTIVWDARFPHTLQSLIITRPFIQIDIHRLAPLLSSLPHLRNLELEQTFLVGPDNIDWDSIAIGQGPHRLPSLQSISIKIEPVDQIVSFLSSLDFPNLVRLQLFVEEFEVWITARAGNNPLLPILASKFCSPCKESGFNLSVIHREDIEDGLDALSCTFPSAQSQQFSFEFVLYRYARSKIDKFHSMIEEIPMSDIKEFTIGTDKWQGTRLFGNLSNASELEAVIFEGLRHPHGASIFASYLAENIPLCDDHQQTVNMWEDASLSGDNHDDDSSEDDEESEDDESDDESNEDDERSGNNEDGSSEEDDSTGDESVHPGDTSGNQDDQNDQKKGEEEVEDYIPCTPCEKCAERGKSFFPALRRLIIRDTDLEEWLTINGGAKKVHPIMAFMIYRIRCGVGIGEVIFEMRQKCCLIFEEAIRSQLKRFCGDFGPSVSVVLVK